jgi:hypothetical protein
MVLVILFSSCIFKSALNEFGTLKKHLWHIMMAPVYKIAWAKLAMGLATRSLQNLKKQHIPKMSFKTPAQNISKAAGVKWKSGKSSNQPTCGLFMSDPV